MSSLGAIQQLPEFLASYRPGEMTLPMGYIAFFLLGALLICWGLVDLIKSNLDIVFLRVTLRADAIEYRGFFTRQHLANADIAGVELKGRFRSWPTLVIHSTGKNAQKISILALFERDDIFDAWIARWPNYADVRKAMETAATQALEMWAVNEPALGDIPAQRKRRLAWAERLTMLPLIGSICIAISSPFASPPFSTALLCLLVALPWFAAAMQISARGALRLALGLAQPIQINLVVLIVCAAALELHATLYTSFVDVSPVLIPVALCMAGLTLAFFFAERRIFQHPVSLVVFLIAAGIYAEGTMLKANALLETAPVEPYAVKVLDKRTSISSNKGRKWTNYRLRIEPWGPFHTEQRISVSQGIYDLIGVGGKICMMLHTGALGVRYYRPDLCPLPVTQTSPFLTPPN